MAHKLFETDFFDFDGDGKVDIDEYMAGLQMIAGSRKEAIALTGDDTFYMGSDKLEDDEKAEEEEDDEEDEDEEGDEDDDIFGDDGDDF